MTVISVYTVHVSKSEKNKCVILKEVIDVHLNTSTICMCFKKKKLLKFCICVLNLHEEVKIMSNLVTIIFIKVKSLEGFVLFDGKFFPDCCIGTSR